MTRRVPNVLLRELLDEANWTGEGLARAVNTVGAEAGLSLRYGRSSVAHWLTGMRPRPPVPELLAEAFSRKLGRPVPVAELGMTGGAEPGGLWDADAAERLLAGDDEAGGVVRRYRLADLAVPGWDELIRTRLRRTWGVADGDKVDRRHVRSAAGMTTLFSDADLAYGGGYVRGSLAGYLAIVVVPWLRAPATPVARRDLLLAVSRLTYLCGFTHFDDDLHGAAQHYYLTNLRLAAEAGDAVGYAITLRALSVQARALGHHRHAVDLAESAVRTVADKAGPRISAFLYGQLAVAHAAGGDRHDAVRCLLIAERHLDRAQDAPVPVGRCHPASLAHQQAVVQAKLGDRAGAIEALTASVRRRPPDERRSRAITLARLAELQFDGGEIEAACGTWRRFVQDYPQLRARRLDRAMVSMRTRLRSHRDNSAVRALRASMATTRISA